MKKKILYILFILFLYLFLFTPPFSIFRDRLAFGNIIVLFSFFFAIMKPKVILRYYKCFRKEFTLLICLFLYVVLRTIFGGQSNYLAQHFLGICNIFIVIPMILYYAKAIGIKTESQMITSFLVVGTVASSISLLCILNPAFQEYLKTNIYRYTIDDYLYLNDYRGFGFANMLTSNYGYILGLLAGYGSLYIKSNKWFLVCIPLLLFASLINARTGTLLGLTIIAVFLFVRKRVSYVFFVGGVISLFLLYNSEIFDIFGVGNRTAEWSMALFEETKEVYNGNVEGSFAVDLMLNEMIVFPNSFIEWLVGCGRSIVGGYLGRHSDIGWIVQLNYGGLFYTVILYTLFYHIIQRLRTNRQTQSMWVMIITILLINTKTSIFPGYTIFYLLMLFYSMNILQWSNNHIEHTNG